MEELNFAIGIDGRNEISNEQFLFDPTYITIDFKAISFNGSPVAEGSSVNYTSYNMSLWNDTFAKVYGQELSDKFQLHNMYCTPNVNFNIKGNILSDEYDYFELAIKKCTGFTYWKSESEIDEALKKYRMVVALTDYYFDVEDYDNPVKFSFQNDYIYPFLPSYTLEK